MAGLYIHIPFCSSRCIYCGFYSTTLSEMKDKYVDAICHEWILRQDYLPSADHEIKTIYLGGGTPSTLSFKQLEKIFDYIYNKVGNNRLPEEVTIECNPDDITEDFAKQLRDLPVNRVSMGAQTFNDDRLRFLHRRHNAEEVRTATERLRRNHIKNISIDLMYGFPKETITDWYQDISDAIKLGVEHISAYSLMIEEGTILHKMLTSGVIKEIDDELSRKMYEMLIDEMEASGYEHYEISNFARRGMYSRHNSNYWNATPYIGIGAAAHSYNETSRQWNVSDVNKYISDIHKNIIPAEKEILDIPTRYDDMITTALRTKAGINLDEVEQKFGEEYRTFLLTNAEKFIHGKMMELQGNRISISRGGLFISDSIMSDLMHV